MNVARALLEMLHRYGVEYVFGLPGETTLGLYDEWKRFEKVTHVMARDERHAVYMADGYARVSGRPGVCEGPSVGAAHMVPGVVEARRSSIPMVVLTTDIPLGVEKRNALTGFDQGSLFAPFAKESLTAHRGGDVPFLVRRAFRVAVSGCPGPVHLRLPQDVLAQEVGQPLPPAQERFGLCPGTRPLPGREEAVEAAQLLAACERGVMVCGQGVLTSRAWEEVERVAERFGLATATTINGKGSIGELHPLSVGVIGSRGSTDFSNSFLEGAGLVFYVGCSTDSVATDGWKLPREPGRVRFIHLNISEGDLGNSFGDGLLLHGDVKATLGAILEAADDLALPVKGSGVPLRGRPAEREPMAKGGCLDPRSATMMVTEAMPEGSVVVADPGMSAVYPAAFWRVPKAGRYFATNYAMGALGWGLGAAIGATYAVSPGTTVLNFIGDGSFGFTSGELETAARLGRNLKVVLFNNGSFGWIRATNYFSYGKPHFATDLGAVDYGALAESYGLESFRASTGEELASALAGFFEGEGPALLELMVPPEDECVPPVPEWGARSREEGLGCHYWER